MTLHKEMNQEGMARETFCITMDQKGMVPGNFLKEMDLKNCNEMAQGTCHEMLLESSSEEMNI